MMTHVEMAEQLTNRIKLIHDYVRNWYALPEYLEKLVHADAGLDEDQQVGTLRNFYVIAQNWERWNFYGVMRAGMRALYRQVASEFRDTYPAEYGPELDFTMPTLTAPATRDWRVGTFDLHGHDVDESPLDVLWTEEQISGIA